MSALTQYINLYNENKTLLESKCSPLLNRHRSAALHLLENMGLPEKGSENYETSDLEAMLAPDFGVNIGRVPFSVNPAASFHCNVPNISSSLYLVVNDSFATTTSAARASLPDGVIVDSLNSAAEKYPGLLDSYFASLADMENPVVALNTMLVQDGVFIYVPKGVCVERPLQIVNILNAKADMMAVRRLLVILEEDARLKLLSCDHTQNEENRFLNLQVAEFHVGRRAHLEYYDMEESNLNTSRLCSLYMRQHEGSFATVNGTTLFNGTTRNEYFCRFEGEHAVLHLLGMGIEDSTRHLDTYSRIDHNVKNCKSDELFKYVLDDEAIGSFIGRIYVAPGASKTEAYQSNRNIVSSDKARMYAKPQLEIYNDDVKCSHGTAIGQLDAMQLFYMRTRGLSDATARLLLKQAFMMDIVDSVKIPSLHDRLRALVEARFEGKSASCSDCAICK